MKLSSYVFGRNSRMELGTCDERLQRLAQHVLMIKDHSIIKGHRGEAAQNAAYASGASKLRWPHGKHNGVPSKAMDVQTHPRPKDERALRDEQLYLLGLYKGVAAMMGLKVRTGGDWDRDGQISDNGWDDLFHVELDEPGHKVAT